MSELLSNPTMLQGLEYARANSKTTDDFIVLRYSSRRINYYTFSGEKVAILKAHMSMGEIVFETQENEITIPDVVEVPEDVIRACGDSGLVKAALYLMQLTTASEAVVHPHGGAPMVVCR